MGNLVMEAVRRFIYEKASFCLKKAAVDYIDGHRLPGTQG